MGQAVSHDKLKSIEEMGQIAKQLEAEAAAGVKLTNAQAASNGKWYSSQGAELVQRTQEMQAVAGSMGMKMKARYD